MFNVSLYRRSHICVASRRWKTQRVSVALACLRILEHVPRVQCVKYRLFAAISSPWIINFLLYDTSMY